MNDKQAAQQKIKEITETFNSDMQALQIIIDKPEIVWPPEVGQIVYCLELNSIVMSYIFQDTNIQRAEIKQCRLHPTKAQAEFYRDSLELESKRTCIRFRLHEFAKRINGGWVANYGHVNQYKYTIDINCVLGKISLVDRTVIKENALPVFKTDCIDELREELTFDEIALLFEVVK